MKKASSVSNIVGLLARALGGEDRPCACYPTFSVSQWPAHAADDRLLHLQQRVMLRTLTGFPHPSACRFRQSSRGTRCSVFNCRAADFSQGALEQKNSETPSGALRYHDCPILGQSYVATTQRYRIFTNQQEYPGFARGPLTAQPLPNRAPSRRSVCGTPVAFCPFVGFTVVEYNAGFSPEGPAWSPRLWRLSHKLIPYKLVLSHYIAGYRKSKALFPALSNLCSVQFIVKL